MANKTNMEAYAFGLEGVIQGLRMNEAAGAPFVAHLQAKATKGESIDPAELGILEERVFVVDTLRSFIERATSLLAVVEGQNEQLAELLGQGLS